MPTALDTYDRVFVATVGHEPSIQPLASVLLILNGRPCPLQA